MLQAAFWILQSAFLLLQSGLQAKEAEEKAAKKRVARASIPCQAAFDQEELEESAESEETAAVEASREVALSKAALEEDMEHCDESSAMAQTLLRWWKKGAPITPRTRQVLSI